jgi:hypothetical protein
VPLQPLADAASAVPEINFAPPAACIGALNGYKRSLTLEFS